MTGKILMVRLDGEDWKDGWPVQGQDGMAWVG
jgi:hypothetical protein